MCSAHNVRRSDGLAAFIYVVLLKGIVAKARVEKKNIMAGHCESGVISKREIGLVIYQLGDLPVLV